MADPRIRRPPAQHDKLLAELAGKDGPFRSAYDALMFATALGKSKGRYTPYDLPGTGDAIRYSLLENRQYGDVLVDLIAAAEVPEDAKVLSDDRLDERLRIFEGYANGGLDYLQGELNLSGSRDLTAVVSALVLAALTPPAGEAQPFGQDILDALDW